MSFMRDLEYELMCYCLKIKGRWWANHYFRNKSVNELYDKLRGVEVGTVMCIVQDGGPNYNRYLENYELRRTCGWVKRN